MSTTEGTIDRSQFDHYLRMLDPNAKWFTFQTFTDCEKDKPDPDPLARVLNLSRFTRPILDLYAQGAGVWVTVNDTQGNGRKKEAVTRIRAVWHEDDDGYDGEFPLEPSLVVETSVEISDDHHHSHFHRYWFVADEWPADTQGVKDFDGVMACMIASYSSCKGAKDISRVLRMPGFMHRKNPAKPHMVRVVGGNRRRYPRARILEAFPPPERVTSALGNGHAGNGADHADLVRQVLTGENFHASLTSLAWRHTGAGMPAGQVVEHLRGIMLSIPDQNRDDRWKARFAEIPKLVNSAVSKHSEPQANGGNGAVVQLNRSERRAAQSEARRIVSTRLSNVKMRPIEWVWSGRIAQGKHTTIAGEPGVSKSTLLYWVAAAVSKGHLWPCGEGKAPIGSVIILSAEDGAEDTIKPRILAAKGDDEKVHIITAAKDGEGTVSSFTLQQDLQALERMIDEIGDVVIVIIDPISSYLGDRVDGHSNTDIRRVVEPLHEMADRKKVAVLTNTHFSKAGAANKSRASHRFIGSTAFVALPRVAFAVVIDPEDEDRRLVLHVKNNIAKAAPGLAYRLVQTLAGYIGDPPDPLFASSIEWESEHVSTTADQAIAKHEEKLRGAGEGKGGVRPSPERDEAEAFLRHFLAIGEKPAKEVNAAAKELGIKEKPLRQARERLVDSGPKRSPDGKVIEGFVWRLKPVTTTEGSDD
jgi:putative DNA primase/helicase